MVLCKRAMNNWRNTKTENNIGLTFFLHNPMLRKRKSAISYVNKQIIKETHCYLSQWGERSVREKMLLMQKNVQTPT